MKINPLHIKDDLPASRYVSAGQREKKETKRRRREMKEEEESIEEPMSFSYRKEKPLVRQSTSLTRHVGGEGERVCIKHTEEGGGLQMATGEKAVRK